MSGTVSLTHRLDVSAIGSTSQQEVLLLASLVAPETAAQAERSPVDLIAVLDRSGSMGISQKLQAVKDTTNFLVQQMSSQDRLGVVTFDDQVVVNFPLKHMTHENKKVVEAAISRIKVGGGTNLSGGLFKGIDQLQQDALAEQARDTSGNSQLPTSPTEADSSQHSGQSQRVRTLFLFTDGQATAGVTNSERLKQILSMMLQNAISPTIYCFGYGADYSTDSLDSISQAGQGSSCFIEDAEAIPGALASALGGLMSMSAQNVELTFAPQAGVSIKEIDTTFPIAIQNGSHIVTVGDLYAEERKDILVKLQIDAVNEARDEQEVVKIALRCLNLSQGRMQQSSNTAVIVRPEQVPAGTAPDLQVQEAVLRLSTAKAIRDAVAKADARDYAGARNLLSNQLSQLQASPQSAVVSALAQDVQQVLSGYGRLGSQPSSRNANLAMSRGHASQRATWHSSAAATALASAQYSTPAQIGMQTSAWIGMQTELARPRTHAAQPDDWADAAQRPQIGSATQPAVSRSPSTQAPSLAGHAPDMNRRAFRANEARARARLARAPSNVSAAGTEVYEPVLDSPTARTLGPDSHRGRLLPSSNTSAPAEDDNSMPGSPSTADRPVAAPPRNAAASFHFPGRLQTQPDTPSVNNMMANGGRSQPNSPHTNHVPSETAPTAPQFTHEDRMNILNVALSSTDITEDDVDLIDNDINGYDELWA